MDIGSGKQYPSNALSNFAPHPFIIDEIQCASMEGFLQSLKFKDIEMQKYVCSLVGMSAKFKGKKKKWWITQTLYWNGIEYKRNSIDYQLLLDKAYDCLFQNDGFKRALIASKGSSLTHSIGKNDQSHTVLTVSEFISRLNKLRNRL